MQLEKLLDTVFRVYKDDLEIEDNPPPTGDIPYGVGDIIELRGNIYIYLWKKTDYGYLGLIATPYTLLAHPSHPRVRTDSPLYEVMAITDLYIPLRDETIKKYITDRLEVITEKTELEQKIENSIKRRKIYHPIREKFLRSEARRTAFLIEEFLREEREENQTSKGKIIKIPAEVLKKLDKPQRLAAESEQETAENEHFLVVKQTENSYALIVKDYNLLGRKIRILLGDTPIYDDLLDTETLFVEVEDPISPTLLADLLKVEV
jgi:hypothetical protein